MKSNHRFLLVSAIFLSWLMLSSEAYSQWWTLGGSNGDEAHSIDVAADDGYFVAGYSRTSATDASMDFLILKLSSIGNIQWQKIFNPDNGTQGANSIQQTPDGGYVLDRS